jgi:hypothetical protein
VKEEKSCCASTAPAAGGAGGRGPALVPPVDDAVRGDACRVGDATATGTSAAGVAGQSTTATGVVSCPAGGEVGDDVVAGWAASSEHVQFQIQFQPARGVLAGALRHAPVQFHTQVQVSGTPGALVVPGDALAAGALALAPETLAAGVLAVAPELLAAGALTLLAEALTPGADTMSPETWTPGADTLSPETLATRELAACCAGACCAGAATSSCAAGGLSSGAADAAGVAAVS